MWRTNKTKQNAFIAFNSCDQIVVLDVETTGFSPEKNHVIQFSAQKYKIVNDFDMELIDQIDLYINPGYSIPPKIVELTGITNEFIAEQPCEDECFEKIYAFLKDLKFVAGQNSKFDIGFMEAMYKRHGKEFTYEFAIDTLAMARDLIPKGETKNYKLGTLASLFGVDYGLSFHNSMDDVTATARLITVFMKEYEKIPEPEPTVKKEVQISSIKYWEGYRGYSRIYINTNLGGFYYDIRSQSWDKKKDNPYSLDEIDMDKLRFDAWALVGATSDREFARYRG